MAKKPVKPELTLVKTDDRELTAQEQAVMEAASRGVGRPKFEWTDELEQEILAGIIAGKSIRQIMVEGGPKFPSADTIYRHIAADPQFSDKYARARDFQQDTYAEEIIAIIDGWHPDFVGKTLAERQAAVEARKWTMGKVKPKKYNDKIIQEITGADGAPLMPTQNIDVSQLTDEARDSLKFALTVLTSRNDAEDIEENDE